jgi:hypothetical protein
MLSRKECCDFCGLTGDEVHAIAQHEHLSDLSAAALGQSLLQTEEGIREIKRFMREDIQSARFRGHPDTAQRARTGLGTVQGNSSFLVWRDRADFYFNRLAGASCAALLARRPAHRELQTQDEDREAAPRSLLRRRER